MNKLDKQNSDKSTSQPFKEYCDKVHKATLTKERTFLTYSQELVEVLNKLSNVKNN